MYSANEHLGLDDDTTSQSLHSLRVTDEDVNQMCTVLADFCSQLTYGLNEDFSFGQNLEYSRWTNDLNGLCLGLSNYLSSFQPQFNQFALVPNHSTPVNPLTGCPEAKLVPDLLYTEPPQDLREKQDELLKYFTETFGEENRDYDSQSLYSSLNDYNAHISKTLKNLHSKRTHSSKYSTERNFGTLISNNFRDKPKDLGALKEVLNALKTGEGLPR